MESAGENHAEETKYSGLVPPGEELQPSATAEPHDSRMNEAHPGQSRVMPLPVEVTGPVAILPWLSHLPADQQVPLGSLCLVCMELIKAEPKPPYKLPCEHAFCDSCLKFYVQTSINSRHVEDVPCPAGSCSTIISDEQIKGIVDPEIYQKYLMFKSEIGLAGNPLLRWCPRPNCPEHVLAPNKTSQIRLFCPCGQDICSLCGRPWHPDSTCLKVQIPCTPAD